MHSLRVALGLALLAVSLMPACKGATTSQLACNPACPPGTRCTSDGCLAESPVGGPMDMTATGEPGDCNPACAGTTPHCSAEGACVPCLVDAHCPQGEVCRASGHSTLCVTGCADDSRCAGGSVCCGGQCAEVSSDPLNCGACGNGCAIPHAAARCAGGACEGGACDSGWGDCDADGSNGCEVNLHADPAHCGGCGQTCKVANGTSGCSGGCYIAACHFGWDDCDGQALNGCEVSVLADAKNCGGCGRACGAVPHARSACVNASCQLASCDVGFADCDANPANGCEAVVSSDATNCGRCGVACGQGLVCKNGGCTCPQCNFPNASSLCQNNVCVIDKCVQGFADCNANPNDGCEADTTSDVKSCGACGVVCPVNTPYCVSGACAALPPCKNIGGGALARDNGLGKGENYCYDQNDSNEVRARKACESHTGIGKCCVIMGGYNSQQYGDCNLGGDNGSIHWHYDNWPNGHCGPMYVVGDLVSPGWCGVVLGNFLK